MQIVGIIQALPRKLYMLASLKRIVEMRHKPRPAAALMAKRAYAGTRRSCLGSEMKPSVVVRINARPP